MLPFDNCDLNLWSIQRSIQQHRQNRFKSKKKPFLLSSPRKEPGSKQHQVANICETRRTVLRGSSCEHAKIPFQSPTRKLKTMCYNYTTMRYRRYELRTTKTTSREQKIFTPFLKNKEALRYYLQRYQSGNILDNLNQCQNGELWLW